MVFLNLSYTELFFSMATTCCEDKQVRHPVHMGCRSLCKINVHWLRVQAADLHTAFGLVNVSEVLKSYRVRSQDSREKFSCSALAATLCPQCIICCICIEDNLVARCTVPAYLWNNLVVNARSMLGQPAARDRSSNAETAGADTRPEILHWKG